MTGTITFASKGYQTNNIAGYYINEFGNFIHSRASTTDHWQIHSNDQSMSLKYYPDVGNLIVPNNITGSTVNGAVWNDYAEYRTQTEEIKPGYCAVSSNSGELRKTNSRLQACDGIVSDTFGFAIGETDDCKTPLAVAGRVLAYCEGDRYDYNAGDTVCATAGGLVSKMTREEIKEYPDRIVGIVSEIPEYDTWGTGNVDVNGRIWIKVR